jgi:hypothetical protein
VRALLVLVLSTITLSAAEAASSTGKEEFEEAVRLFRAQKHERALPLFVKAYELSGRRPATVLALAQCERALKMYDEALTHYREYLASTPRPKDSQSVLETVKLLEEQKPLAPPAPEAVDVRLEAPAITQAELPLADPVAHVSLLPANVERTAAPEADEGLSVAKITILAAGAAAAIAGGVFAYRAASLERDVEDAVMLGARPPAEVRATADRGFESAIAADALIGTGLVAIVIGLWID